MCFYIHRMSESSSFRCFKGQAVYKIVSNNSCAARCVHSPSGARCGATGRSFIGLCNPWPYLAQLFWDAWGDYHDDGYMSSLYTPIDVNNQHFTILGQSFNHRLTMTPPLLTMINRDFISWPLIHLQSHLAVGTLYPTPPDPAPVDNCWDVNYHHLRWLVAWSTAKSLCIPFSCWFLPPIISH